MIRIEKEIQAKVYELELTKQTKDKNSPFVAILMLVQEKGKVNSKLLQEYLFPVLPERACANLLARLEAQDYLEDILSNGIYSLSEKGEESAADKTCWVGEKGIYEVYLYHSDLIDEALLYIRNIKNLSRSPNTKSIPSEINRLENKTISIRDELIQLQGIGDKCIMSDSRLLRMSIEANNTHVELRIKENSTLIYKKQLESTEADLREALLMSNHVFDYDADRKSVSVGFDKENLSFDRNLHIGSCSYLGEEYNNVKLDNVSCYPQTENEAQNWYEALLVDNINGYFFSDKEFEVYQQQYYENFETDLLMYKYGRGELAKTIRDHENCFYKRAKLETIDYLYYEDSY